MSAQTALERTIRRDRALMLSGLALVALVSWVWLVKMASVMGATAVEKGLHAAMGMPEMAAWGLHELAMLFVMWAVMMVAMMLPSAAPLILLVVGVYRRRGSGARVLTTSFASGYLIAWTGFSAAAAIMQVLLHRAALLTPVMATATSAAAGVLLLVAGIYQWLPIKHACLAHCRSPLHHLTREWREGALGALVMGLRHGAYCVGCCWALMLVLFVAGVMNLLWIAAIAALVLVEKLTRLGPHAGKLAGIVLVALGALLLVRP